MANKIIKEGWLQKKSRYIGCLRKRWTVLTENMLCTYKSKKNYTTPTEMIELSTITFIESSLHDTSFTLQQYIISFEFVTEEYYDKLQWINAIIAYQNTITVPINITCQNHLKYNSDLPYMLAIPYYSHYQYTLKTFLADIIEAVNKKHNPTKFYVTKISNKSFIRNESDNEELIDYDLSANIMKYTKLNMLQIGLHVTIEIEIYERGTFISCNDMINHSNCSLIMSYGCTKIFDLYCDSLLDYSDEREHKLDMDTSVNIAIEEREIDEEYEFESHHAEFHKAKYIDSKTFNIICGYCRQHQISSKSTIEITYIIVLFYSKTIDCSIYPIYKYVHWPVYTLSCLNQASQFWTYKLSTVGFKTKFKQPQTRESFRNTVFKCGLPISFRCKIWLFCVLNQWPQSDINTSVLDDNYNYNCKECKQHRFTNVKSFKYRINASKLYPCLTSFQQQQIETTAISLVHKYYPSIDRVAGRELKNSFKLATHLLLYMSPQYAYECLIRLINIKLKNVYQYEIFEDLLAYNDKSLYTKLFHEFNDTTLLQYYFLECTESLFVGILSVSVVSRVWDIVIMFGVEEIYKCFVAMFKILKNHIISAKNCIDIIKHLYQRTMNIKATELVAMMKTIRILDHVSQELKCVSNTLFALPNEMDVVIKSNRCDSVLSDCTIYM